MKYVIWGAGIRGTRLFAHLGEENVIAFVDKKQLVKIKNFDVNNKEKEQLIELGIYVNDDSICEVRHKPN